MARCGARRTAGAGAWGSARVAAGGDGQRTRCQESRITPQDTWSKRFVRDHLRIRDEITCAAARVILAVREHASNNKDSSGSSRFRKKKTEGSYDALPIIQSNQRQSRCECNLYHRISSHRFTFGGSPSWTISQLASTRSLSTEELLNNIMEF